MKTANLPSSIKSGIYQHYKGKKYRVLGVGLHSETLEEMVIYQALYGKKLILHDISIMAYTNPKFDRDTSIMQFQSSARNWLWVKGSQESNIQVSGKPTWIIEGQVNFPDNKPYWQKYILISGPDNSLIEVIWFDAPDQNAKNIFNQILSTFHFLK